MTTTPITRRTGLNRTVLLRAGAPWHGHRAGRVLGATGLSGIVADAAAGAAVALDDAPLVTLDRVLLAGEQWAEAVAEQWTDALAHLLQTLRPHRRRPGGTGGVGRGGLGALGIGAADRALRRGRRRRARAAGIPRPARRRAARRRGP
ncbi:hypothetical protein [Serinicoccus marinus]|uniref:hypothetical protein n=1 Tax=Serinicoccus marinus TaxID=247333 RepID=UPI00122DEC78|nr:hypothetical protein [Serinicoccus marinus]